jgi:Protein of unknown function (DUF2585)
MKNLNFGDVVQLKSGGLRRFRAGLWAYVAIALVLGLHVFALRHEGRRWWCACGQAAIWSGDVNSPHNSQHVFDPYSFTHVLHGFVFCGLLAWMLPRVAVPWRFAMAVTAEAAWEVFENSAFVIDRYRVATASLGYQGDTVANSLGDILSCAVGFAIARRIGVRWSVALFFATEVLLLVWIRDNLFLNVLMLIYPVQAVKAWQLGQ